MRRGFLIVVVAVVVVLAGCQAPSSPQVSPTPSPEVDTSPTAVETPPSPTPEPTPPPTPTPEPVHPANPYGSDELAVYVHDSEMDRDVSPMLNSSFAYWENHSEEFAGYPVEYHRVDSPESADIHITFQEITACGFHTPTENLYFGCADVIEPYSTAPTPVNVKIHSNLSNPEIELTLIHELGHTLGLEHDDEPQEYMAASLPLVANDPVGVYLQPSQGSLPFGVEHTVADGLDYFADHDELDDPEQLTWVFVDDIDDANIVITYHRTAGACGFSDGGSCIYPGYEYDDQYQLHLANLDDTIAWHVAYQLSPLIFPEDEMPDELSPHTDRRDREQFP